jgi:Brp/Blh family beta-carotene 15,15'-monooxygenase
MIFKQLNNFSLVATFFGVWLGVFFEDAVEDVFAYLLIFTFGILHGANDLKLMSHSGNARSDSKQFFLTFLYYVLFVLGCALLFYFLASFALLFFILFSAYHFGEQHWSHTLRKTIGMNGVFYTSYGLLLLLLLFTSHSAEVSDIIEEITGISVHKEFYRYALWLSILTTSILYGIIQKSKVLTWFTLKEFFYLCLFLLVFSTASLLWSFAIYFILWHSLPSMLDQIRYLYGDYSKEHMLRYVLSSSLYWIVSITALAFLFLFFKKTDQTFLALFFSFLAALTFPHVLVITKLYKN